MGSEVIVAGTTWQTYWRNKKLLCGLFLYSILLVLCCLMFMEKRAIPISLSFITEPTIKVNTTHAKDEETKKMIRAATTVSTNSKGKHVMEPATITGKLLLEIPLGNQSFDDIVIMLQNHPKLQKLFNARERNKTSVNRTCATNENVDKETVISDGQEKVISDGQEELSKEFFNMSNRPLTLNYYKSMKTKEPFRRRCHSCALVSSSGHLVGSGAGQDIDSHECVLRMNNAPTEGFEKDVGARTNIRVSCFISVPLISNNAMELLTGKGTPDALMVWGLEHKSNKKQLEVAKKLASRFPGINMYSHEMAGETEANKVFERETGRNLLKTHSWLSTGWFTIRIALEMCEKIDVYGMAQEDYCKISASKSTKYHYYQPKADPTECSFYKGHEVSGKGGHRFMTEKLVFARWGLKYNISFHHPQWNVSKEAAKALDTPFTKKFKKTNG